MRLPLVLSRARYACLCLLVLSFPAHALAGVAGEGVDKEIRAHRASRAPVIDGSLQDSIWQRIPADTSFTQHFPLEGEAPSTASAVRVAFDDENLYVAVELSDPEPDKISAQVARRDSLISSDFVEIFLDTRHSHDSGYWFRVNAAGVIADGEIHDDNRINFDWDAVWTGKANIHGGGWSAEFSIPLSVLRFPSQGSPLFGFNVKRGVRRSGEIAHWCHIPRSASGALSRAGHIVGLETLEPVRAIELRPFGVIRLETELEQGGSFAFGDAQSTADLSLGMDAKIGLTEGLTLDATVNPDFGQVEADPVVLNLSTFETFFPEKRPFFLEGAGLFKTDIQLIHSRRIGERTTRLGQGSTLTLADGSSATVSASQLSVPIYGAARVTGSVGEHFSINALNAVTGPEEVETGDGFEREIVEVAPARNYTAARGKYSFGGSSYLGFVATSVARLGESIVPEANHDSFTESIDGRWVRSDGMYRLYFQVAGSQRRGGDTYEEGDRNCGAGTSCRPFTRPDGTIQGPGDFGSAGELGASKAGGVMRFYTRYRYVTPTFDVDDLGFENDWDYHEGVAHSAYHYEEEFLWFQRGELQLNGLTHYGFGGERKQLSVNARATVLANNFWSGGLTLEYKPPGSFTTRETSDGARFELSDIVRADMDIESDNRRDLSAGFGAELLTSPSTELELANAYAFSTYRPTPPLELNLQSNIGFRRNNLRVIDCETDEGSCWRRSLSRDYVLALQDSQSLDVTARANWAISTELSLEGYMQIFAAGGSLHDYRAVYGLEGERPTIARGDAEEIPFDGDADQDGNPDSAFSFATLNANVVLRWELFAGTTLIAVYTRAQRHSRERERLAWSGLRRGQAEEIFLLKATLFAGL